MWLEFLFAIELIICEAATEPIRFTNSRIHRGYINNYVLFLCSFNQPYLSNANLKRNITTRLTFSLEFQTPVYLRITVTQTLRVPDVDNLDIT